MTVAEGRMGWIDDKHKVTPGEGKCERMPPISSLVGV